MCTRFLLALAVGSLAFSVASPAAAVAPLTPISPLTPLMSVAVTRASMYWAAPTCLQVVANNCPARMSHPSPQLVSATFIIPASAGAPAPAGDWLPALPALATGLGATRYDVYLHRTKLIETFRRVRYRYYRRRQQAPNTHSPLSFWLSRPVVVSYCLTSPALPPTVAVLPLGA